MEASGEKRQCRCKVFKRIPHIFKPLQVIISIAILISALTIGGNTDELWPTALASLLTSGAATALVFLGIQHKLVQRYFCGKLTWNAIEFLYSTILAFYSVSSAVSSFGRSSWYYDWIQYLICGILFVVMFISYLVPMLFIARKELKTLLAESDPVKSPVSTSTIAPESKPEKSTDIAEYANDLESLLDH